MDSGERYVDRKELEWSEMTHGDVFTVREKVLGGAAGSEELGCTLYELPPNRRTWPYHYHLGNEEALYVLSGEGTLRTESGTRPISEGVYAAFPSGRAGAHQVINTSDDSLEYLCFSTNNEPEIIVYPDSEKAVAAGELAEDEAFRRMVPLDVDLEYWEGEPTDPSAFEE